MQRDELDETCAEAAPSLMGRSISAERTNAVTCPNLWLIRKGAGIVACPCVVPFLALLLMSLGASNAWLYGYKYADTALEYVGGAFMGLGIMPPAYLALSLRTLTETKDGALEKLGVNATLISKAARSRLELLHAFLATVSLASTCVLAPWTMLQPLFMESPPMLPDETEWTTVTIADNEITGLVLVAWPLVVSAWILSENTAAVLAADAVEEVIHSIKDESIAPSNAQWAQRVERPAVAVACCTMEELSCWGPGLVAAVASSLILAFSQFILFLASNGAMYTYVHLGLSEYSTVAGLRFHIKIMCRISFIAHKLSG